MKYEEICKRYAEIVVEYIGKGYIYDGVKMDGRNGVILKIGLTNGKENIRLLLVAFRQVDEGVGLSGMGITVGLVRDKEEYQGDYDYSCFGDDFMEVLACEEFFEVGENRKGEKFYGTKDEAVAATLLRVYRLLCRHTKDYVDMTDIAMDFAKRIIRREFGVEQICEEDIRVIKNGAYIVEYRDKAYFIEPRGENHYVQF